MDLHGFSHGRLESSEEGHLGGMRGNRLKKKKSTLVRRRIPGAPTTKEQEREQAGDAIYDENQSWDYFDRLREQQVSPYSPKSDVYRMPSILDEHKGGDSSNFFDLRHITAIIGLLFDDDIPSQGFVDAAGAALMALHHFNNAIETVVPEIKTVTEECKARFTMDVLDTNFSPIAGSRKFLEGVLTTRRGGLAETDDLDETLDSNIHSRRIPVVPTAIIGAIRSAVTTPLATLTGIHGIPQISFASTSTDLDNRDQFPLFGRVIPSLAADATLAVDYFSNVLKVTHFGVLHVMDSYGTSYARELKQAAAEVQTNPLKVRAAPYPTGKRTNRASVIAKAVRQLKESGVRYFFGAFAFRDYKIVMAEARAQGIAGEGYFWMFSDSLLGLEGKSFHRSRQRDLIEASHGTAILAVARPTILNGMNSYNEFLRHWAELRKEESDGRRYFDAKMMPQFQKVKNGTKLLQEFQFSDTPSSYSALSYESVIATTFAVCNSISAKSAGAENKPIPKKVTGKDVFNSFLNVTFDGLYGKVSINTTTGTRRAQTIPYTVSNILLPDPPDENGMVHVRFVNTDVIGMGDMGDVQRSSAAAGGSSWRRLQPFIFSDGTDQAPQALPTHEHDPHLIGTGARAAGYCMCSLTVLTSLVFSAWTFHNRERRVIKSSQPIFLYFFAAGTALTGLAIVPLGFEEPTPQSGLDAACMAAPWLMIMGFSFTFGALYAKEVRICKLMKRDLRRVKVTAKQVMKPAAILLGVNMLLLSVWTGVARSIYKRTIVEGSYDEFNRPAQSIGRCYLSRDPNDADQTWWVAFLFVSLIAVVNGGMLTVALYQVYKTRHIETEFSESIYIARSMVSIAQTFLIGVPIVFASRYVPRRLFLLVSFLIFLMCQFILMQIFVPKVFFLREWKKKQAWRAKERERKSKLPTWMRNTDSATRDDNKMNGSIEMVPKVTPNVGIEQERGDTGA